MDIKQKQVELFMVKAGQPVEYVPAIPSEEAMRHAARILLEETIETINAMGYEIRVGEKVFLEQDGYIMIRKSDPDLVEIADGYTDVDYVVQVGYNTFGLPGDALFSEVAQNNLDKFRGAYSFSSTGKLIKPPNHPKPDIEGIVKRYRDLGYQQLELNFEDDNGDDPDQD